MAEIRAFVCGHPIVHSRSPKIHGEWIKTFGLEGRYDAVDVAPSEFERFLTTLPQQNLAGGNVTIPHKEAAFRLVARRDAAAEAIGAVNTVWVEDGKVVGSNTDAYGFAANLDDRAPGWDDGKTALVIGAGGASRAILHALEERGFNDIRVTNRTVERAAKLARIFAGVTAHPFAATSELAGEVDLVVNTTSLGMRGETDLPVDVA
ncbi:shikimate dehydrogenase, partial [Escherichia coli]|nr:shikimate dehydrogenase [Escherichia coli]